jgi:hypothetical protein
MGRVGKEILPMKRRIRGEREGRTMVFGFWFLIPLEVVDD